MPRDRGPRYRFWYRLSLGGGERTAWQCISARTAAALACAIDRGRIELFLGTAEEACWLTPPSEQLRLLPPAPVFANPEDLYHFPED
jgi:hypothetical protein